MPKKRVEQDDVLKRAPVKAHIMEMIFKKIWHLRFYCINVMFLSPHDFTFIICLFSEAEASVESHASCTDGGQMKEKK